MRIVAIALLFAACGPKKWKATPEQMSPLPPLPTLPTAIGPLSLEPEAPATPWSDFLAKQRLTDNRYLDANRIREETAAYLTVVDTFFKPLTAETKTGVEEAHRNAALLDRLAPYSMTSVTQAYHSASQRLALCMFGAGLIGSCNRDRARVPRPTPQSAYEVRWAEPGIGLVVVHNLTTDATAPQWKSFTTDLGKIADARGVIIDLRDAAGTDPRPLLAWVSKLTNRRDIKPLRAIERPDAADEYVAAYRAKFTDRGRNVEVWRAYVGETSPATKPPALPVSVLVGRYCQSACELIARSLATYANATVIGGVIRAGRVARDEPALAYLPHSQTTLYFHATRYLFNAEIEAATGPTEEWHALVAGDGPDDTLAANPSAASTSRYVDKFAFAVRDLKYRIDHPQGWPRCDALPMTKKANNVELLARGSPFCGGGVTITIRSNIPNSAMRRFLATCSMPLQAHSYIPGEYWIRTHGNPRPSADVLSQIASSELVDRVDINCEPRVHH